MNKDRSEPLILAFCCHYCAYAAADLAGSLRLRYPANVRLLRVPCTGKVEVAQLLRAFEWGIDGVIVAGCLEGGCHFLEGNLRARKRVERAKKLLGEIGLESERLEMYNLSSAEAPRFAEIVREMVERVKALGPSPLRRDRATMADFPVDAHIKMASEPAAGSGTSCRCGPAGCGRDSPGAGA